MDDIRTSIIQSVMQALSGKADDDTINLVQDVLIMQYNNYEVQERCTEVAVRDDSAQGLLKKFLATKRVEGIRKACTSIRDLALVDFLYCTGCRVSEVSRLDIVDIDFERMECVVLGKGNKERKVYLTEVAAMHLQEYLASREKASEALFVGKGKRLKKSGIEAIIKK